MADASASKDEDLVPDEYPVVEAKVAKVLNLTDLVLNRGEAHGVRVGMQFAILNRNASNITDPDTGELIGSVPVAKTIVKAIKVQDSMTIARTYRSTSSGFSSLALMIGGTGRRETLKTNESLAIQELDEADSYVKIGDDAVQVTDDDEYLLPDI